MKNIVTSLLALKSDIFVRSSKLKTKDTHENYVELTEANACSDVGEKQIERKQKLSCRCGGQMGDYFVADAYCAVH